MTKPKEANRTWIPTLPRLGLPTQGIPVLALKASILAVAVIALYLQDLVIVFTDAISYEATSYILVIPVLFVYLLYRKRKMVRATISYETDTASKNTRYFATLCGILLCLTATIFYWYGSYTFTPIEYHVSTLPFFIAGLILVFFNLKTLIQALFPVAFLIFLVPPPSEVLYNLGSTLSVISSEASTAMVRFFGIPATLIGEYGTPTILVPAPDGTTISFAVDIACSGIYSLIGFLIFAVFIAYIVRGKAWKKIAAFIMGFPLIYFLNIMRIAIILSLGYNIGAQLALDAFHLLGGWFLVFIGTLLLLAITEKLLKARLFTSKTSATCNACNSGSLRSTKACVVCGKMINFPTSKFDRRDFARIACIAISIMLLVSIQAPVFAMTRSPAPVIIDTPEGSQGNVQLFPNIEGYALQFEYRNTAFEEKYKQDFTLMYIYTPSDSNKQEVWVGLQIASTTTSLHKWETCLISWPQMQGYQLKVTQVELKDVHISDNPPIVARYFAFQYLADSQIQLVFYWYETSIFTIENSTQQKHVQISLITYPHTLEDIPKIEADLLQIAEAISSHWQPTKAWGMLTLLLSQYGLQLTAASIALLVSSIVLWLLEIKKRVNANASAYKKLSQQDQRLIDAVEKVGKSGLSTLSKIKDSYDRADSPTINTQSLEQELVRLKKTGVLKSDISNSQDEPIWTWKTDMKFIFRKR